MCRRVCFSPEALGEDAFQGLPGVWRRRVVGSWPLPTFEGGEVGAQGVGGDSQASLRPSPVASGLPLALAPPSSTFRDPLDSVGPPGTSGELLRLEVCDLVTPAQCAWAMRGDSHRFWVRMGARREASPERGPVGFFNPKSQPNHPGSWQIHNITAGLCANQLF